MNLRVALPLIHHDLVTAASTLGVTVPIGGLRVPLAGDDVDVWLDGHDHELLTVHQEERRRIVGMGGGEIA